jgi:hypothetical protein
MNDSLFPFFLEALESRIAPAVIISTDGHSATYTDVDGDQVTIKVSDGLLTAGMFTTTAKGTGEQLNSINFSGGGFDGADITFSVKKSAGGDGFADVGAINSKGHDLGKVTIKGDIGQITAGDGDDSHLAIEKLTAHSVALRGLVTQNNTGSVNSVINGSIGSIITDSDYEGVLFVTGSISSFTVGGSFIGDPNSNAIVNTTGNIEKLTIKGDFHGGINANTGYITVGGSIGDISIGGSFVGGGGENSGSIKSTGSIGDIFIGGSIVQTTAGNAYIKAQTGIGDITVHGSLEGGEIGAFNGDIGNVTVGGSLHGKPGFQSGFILATGNMGNVKVGGDLFGSKNAGSGSIYTVNGTMGNVTVGGSLVAGEGLDSGAIVGAGGLGNVKIGGSLVNESTAPNGGAGSISTFGSMGNVSIGGDITNPGYTSHDAIHAGNDIGNVKIGGSLGTADTTAVIKSVNGSIGSVTVGHNVYGAISAYKDIGNIKIGENLQGMKVDHSGVIETQTGDIGSITIGGSVSGANDAARSQSGMISAEGDIKSVKIGGDLKGSAAQASGYIGAGGSVGSITIGGSLQGGLGNSSGDISIGGKVKTIKIAGDMHGVDISGTQSLSYSAAITVGGVGGTTNGSLGKLQIGGSILAGLNSGTGTVLGSNMVRVAGQIGSLDVKGSIQGTRYVGAMDVNIFAVGQNVGSGSSDVAIKSIHVGGVVNHTNILAGLVEPATAGGAFHALNADAQIGKVTVEGDWITSTIVAGAMDGGDGYGNANDTKNAGAGVQDDAKIISKIASVVVKGAIRGESQRFGFVAEEVGSVKIAGNTIELQKGPHNDNATLGLPAANIFEV